MNLHENKRLFKDAVLAASEFLDISPVYIEKDYWITRSLKLLAHNETAGKAVFKGGSSLSKGYRIGNRFSEDIDIAVSDEDIESGNKLKALIKKIAKDMTLGMEEVVFPGVTSKGSRYYKALYAYPNILGKAFRGTVGKGQLMVKINSFANPRRYVSKEVDCFIREFLRATGHDDIIGEYGLEPFALNVLDKRQTLIEKLAALIRFSFSDNYIYDLAAKIRHFHDLHFLLQDKECGAYIASEQFRADFAALLEHDRAIFNKPDGWNSRDIGESPLLTDFEGVWCSLRETYKREIPAITFSGVPQENDVAESFKSILTML